MAMPFSVYAADPTITVSGSDNNDTGYMDELVVGKGTPFKVDMNTDTAKANKAKRDKLMNDTLGDVGIKPVKLAPVPEQGFKPANISKTLHLSPNSGALK